jgi:UDP-N-acetyl-D-mannosaminuronic acid dehydrogenase
VGDLQGKTIGILGMAFKAEVDDPRDSLSYKLKSLLELETGTVLCSDPYVREAGLVPAEDLVDRSDLILIGTPHKLYKQLDFHGKRVIDVWNILGKGTAL